jgi:hypothetical protein
MDQARRERIRGLTRRLELLRSEIGDLLKEGPFKPFKRRSPRSKGTESAQTSSDLAHSLEAAVDGIETAITSLRTAVGDDSA